MSLQSLNSISLPDTLENHGEGYRFFPPEILHDNGEGDPVQAPYWSATWKFDFLEPADYDWITVTLLGGASSAHFTEASLYDDNRDIVPYASVIVRRPTHDGLVNGWYRGVVWQIDQLMI